MASENSSARVFMVDRDLPGITGEQLAAAQQAAIKTSQEFASAGNPVRYLRSTFVPGEARLMCLFEAPDADIVERVNQAAGLPYTRVVQAVDLTP